jgi:Putative peptidoglycan binding domain
MTVASKTRNWQRQPVGTPGPPKGPPCAPSLVPIRSYLTERWGGLHLSSEAMWEERPIVGGKLPSSHRGAAFDWRYSNPGPGRETLLREVLPFLIAHSLELNIQQIHDYVGCTIWKAERARNADGGWKTQQRGSQMGQPWAGWIHIEAGVWGWDDGRPVAVKLGLVSDNAGNGEQAPSIVTDLTNGVFGLWPLNGDKPRLKLGSLGDAVLYLQSVIFHRAGGGIARDSSYGNQTKRRVRDVQREHGLTVDGAVGPQTWPVIDRLAA